ncbi:MAG: nickel pincer cofactor biosynthesis protein LarC [Pseudomonadota bacterium]
MLAYFDCISGISGDMVLGAFVDLGVPLEWLVSELKRLPLSGFSISRSVVHRHGIGACRIQVDVTAPQSPKTYAEIASRIQKSALPQAVKHRSADIFDRIATAESKIHGCPKEKVHFHEVGGIDAMVDIVGASLCIEYLSVHEVISSKIPLGSGLVSCTHGTLPVPAPATLEILKGIPVCGTAAPCEIATPTGAAIIASFAKRFGGMPDMIVEKIGYGAGEHELESLPNVLRIVMGKRMESPFNTGGEDQVTIVECCIDDMNPEIYGFLMERLFEDGALDVYWIPIFMKKNRPATLVQVICREEHQETVIHRILSETTTLGVRHMNAQRRVLSREQILIQTVYGEIPAKRVRDLKGEARIVPEYEVCRKIALEKNLPLRIVYDAVLKHTGDGS